MNAEQAQVLLSLLTWINFSLGIIAGVSVGHLILAVKRALH